MEGVEETNAGKDGAGGGLEEVWGDLGEGGGELGVAAVVGGRIERYVACIVHFTLYIYPLQETLLVQQGHKYFL